MACSCADRSLGESNMKLIKLTAVDNKSKYISSHVVAAKNIRIELKAVFPNTKFSVRSESFSMGNAVRVSWTDGPTDEEVSDIANKYEYGRFDAMQDLQYSEHTSFMDDHGGTKYLTTSRSYSASFVQVAINYIWHKYQVAADKITPDQFFNGDGWNVPVIENGGRDHCAQSYIHKQLSKINRK